MRDCAHYQALISRLIDREITPEEGEELAAHARECEECRAVYAAFSALSDMIGDDLVEPPEELGENVMAELRRSELWKKNKKPRRLRRIAALAACAALIVGLGALTLPRLFARKGASSDAALFSTAAAAEKPMAAPAAGEAARYDNGAAADDTPAERETPIPVSDSFAAPAQDTTKSEEQMIYDAIARSEEPETEAEIVNVTGQGRGQGIAALLVGTPGELPPADEARPDRRFLLRFDVDGVSSQVLISVYGEKVFYISLSGEESDMMLSDYGWSTFRARIYN